MSAEMDYYFKKKPGKVYMFLQQDFKDYSPRNESDVEADAANITTCFKKLGFKVKNSMRNFTLEQIKSRLIKACRSGNLREYKSMLVFFITHSPGGGQFLCRDGTFLAENIMKIFIDEDKHPDLRKILVFQASQATFTGDSPATDSDATPFFTYHSVPLPFGANFFIIKSSFELASPNESGSFFIQILCQFMANVGPKTSLFDVITAVLGVLKARRSKFPKELRNNILPEVTSTLLKPFHLKGNIPLYLPNYEDKESIGKLVVFNYTYTSVNAEREPREGTQFDVARFRESFASIGFKVEINNDLRADDLRKTLENGSRCGDPHCTSKKCGFWHEGDAPTDYSEDTCTAIAVLSHGQGNLFQTIDDSIMVPDAMRRLIIKTNKERKDLSGKPKLFFLQICRKGGEQNTEPLQFDDTLVFHSCFPGYESSRNPTDGSWFIKRLCKIIDRIPHGKPVSMADILQEVQQRFVEKHGRAQMPVIYSTLTKNLIVRKASPKMLAKL